MDFEYECEPGILDASPWLIELAQQVIDFLDAWGISLDTCGF